jgi:enterochelin esterase-like enzyme
MRTMIVVMHASDVLLQNGKRADNLKEFEPLLVKEVVPEIRKRYRVAPNPDLWAIAGLSLGGEIAKTVGLRHPELFRTAASLSGSMVERDFEDRFGARSPNLQGHHRAVPADLAGLRNGRHFLRRQQTARREVYIDWHKKSVRRTSGISRHARLSPRPRGFVAATVPVI